MSFIGQYLNSFRRVQTFISQPDLVPTETTDGDQAKIVIENAEFTWPGTTQSTLKNVNLNVSFTMNPFLYESKTIVGKERGLIDGSRICW